MRRNLIIVISVAIVAFALGVLVPLRANIGNGQRDEVRDSRTTSHRETMELLDIIKTWKATKDLELSPEQVNSFIPKFNRMEGVKRVYYADRKRLINEAGKLVAESGNREQSVGLESELEKLLVQLKDLDDGFVQEVSHAYEDLESDLTVIQRASLVLFLEDYKRDIRRIMMRMKDIADRKQ
jgi:hypothetical protein